MNAEQISLEYELIAEMKQEYHHKIAILEKEKEELLRYTNQPHGSQEKGHAVNPKDKAKYTTRIDSLQSQLKDYRKKVKEQKNLEKLVTNQNMKIKELAQQIKKSKLQKMDLSRKLKIDKE